MIWSMRSIDSIRSSSRRNECISRSRTSFELDSNVTRAETFGSGVSGIASANGEAIV